MDYENVFIVLMVGGTLYILMSRFIGLGYHHGRCGGYAACRHVQPTEADGAARENFDHDSRSGVRRRDADRASPGRS